MMLAKKVMCHENIVKIQDSNMLSLLVVNVLPIMCTANCSSAQLAGLTTGVKNRRALLQCLAMLRFILAGNRF
jgi:hypothetical protein